MTYTIDNHGNIVILAENQYLKIKRAQWRQARELQRKKQQLAK